MFIPDVPPVGCFKCNVIRFVGKVKAAKTDAVCAPVQQAVVPGDEEVDVFRLQPVVYGVPVPLQVVRVREQFALEQAYKREFFVADHPLCPVVTGSKLFLYAPDLFLFIET